LTQQADAGFSSPRKISSRVQEYENVSREFVFSMQALLAKLVSCFLFLRMRKGLRKGNDFCLGKRSFLKKATFGKWPAILKELPHSIAL
jgi:hypothetical protein